MNPNSMSGVRAAVAAHTAQQQTAHTQQQASHRPGDQVAHYKGATLRTSFAMARPGGMAKGMLAKLKPRPSPTNNGGVARAQADTVESSTEHARGPGRGSEHDGPESHEPRVERLERDGGGQRQGSSGGDDEPPSRDEGEGRPRRHRVRAAVRPSDPARRSDAVLRAEWAVAAMASGGTSALERALATRLYQVARGPGTVGWRRPWIGNIGALHAAAGGAPFGEDGARGWSGVRATLVALSAGAAPALRLLPNTMRATMFCLLPLVLLDLQRPRTAAQRQDLLVRLAVLSRMSRQPRPF